MSLHALKLASSNGNVVSNLINSQNLPLICVTGMGTLHLLSCFVMSHLRFSNKSNLKYFTSTEFKIISRAQANIAEYSGILAAMMLFIQYNNDKNGTSITTAQKIGCIGSFLGQLLFFIGYGSQKSWKPSQVKLVGVLTRYLGFSALCFSLFKQCNQSQSRTSVFLG